MADTIKTEKPDSSDEAKKLENGTDVTNISGETLFSKNYNNTPIEIY